MNKRELVSRVSNVLRENGVAKPVSSPKKVLHISDDEGNCRDFIVKQVNKKVLFNINDINSIIDACLAVIEDSIKRGEEVSIHGFGTLGVHKRAGRVTKHPITQEWVNVDERYVPKFSFGNNLRTAAKLYELSLKDNTKESSCVLDNKEGEINVDRN